MNRMRVPSKPAAISPARLAHVVLRTPNIAASMQWWQDLLNAHVVFASPLVTFLTYDEEHHRIALLNMPGLEPKTDTSAGVDHFAFTYADLGALLANYERLKAIGVTPSWCINHGPTTSMYYRDPDGNQVELQVDNFDTEAELRGFFHSDAFRLNPIGVGFDPDILVARFQAGEPVRELVKQGSTQPLT